MFLTTAVQSWQISQANIELIMEVIVGNKSLSAALAKALELGKMYTDLWVLEEEGES